MTMKNCLDHVGILVADIERCVERLRPHGWPIGEIESFPSEGTKEVYIGPPRDSGRLLLMESIGDGPYKTAMRKRGPGLHHVAISVPDFKRFVERVSGSGWLLHPKSLITQAEHKTIWLARPGIPMLVEILEQNSGDGPCLDGAEAFITRVEVPLPEAKPSLASALGVGDGISPSQEADVVLTVGERRLALKEFVLNAV